MSGKLVFESHGEVVACARCGGEPESSTATKPGFKTMLVHCPRGCAVVSSTIVEDADAATCEGARKFLVDAWNMEQREDVRRLTGIDVPMLNLASVGRERVRQVKEKGFDAATDAKHAIGALATLAAYFALPDAIVVRGKRTDTQEEVTVDLELAALLEAYGWSLTGNGRKGTKYRERIVKAAALLVAELDRLDIWEKENGKNYD